MRDLRNAVYVYDRELAAASSLVINLMFLLGSRDNDVYHVGAAGGTSIIKPYQLYQLVIYYLLQPENCFLTRDATAAKLFFVPHFAATATQWHPYGKSKSENIAVVSHALELTLAVVNVTAAWRRFDGADRVWVFPFDTGVGTIASFRSLLTGRRTAWAPSDECAQTPYTRVPRDVVTPVPVKYSWTAAETAE